MGYNSQGKSHIEVNQLICAFGNTIFPNPSSLNLFFIYILRFTEWKNCYGTFIYFDKKVVKDSERHSV